MAPMLANVHPKCAVVPCNVLWIFFHQCALDAKKLAQCFSDTLDVFDWVISTTMRLPTTIYAVSPINMIGCLSHTLTREFTSLKS